MRRRTLLLARLCAPAALLAALLGCREPATTVAPPATAAVVATSTATPPAPTVVAPTTATVGSGPVAEPAPGLILFQTMPPRAIWEMNGDGTGRHLLVPYDPVAQRYGRAPDWAPDGRHLAYVYIYEEGGRLWERVHIASRDGSLDRPVGQPTQSAAFGWIDADSLILFSVRDDRPFTQTYRLSAGTVGVYERPGRGDHLEWSPSPGFRTIAMRKKGSLDYVLLDVASGKETTIFRVPEEGRTWGVIDGYWSRDGETLAFTYWDPRTVGPMDWWDLYTVRADGSGLRRLTYFKAEYEDGSSPVSIADVAWSPDGRWLAFRLAYGNRHVYLAVMPAGGGQITNLGVDVGNASVAPVWSPDSTRLAFDSNRPFENGRLGDEHAPDAQWDLYTVDIRTKAIQRLTDDPDMEMYVTWG